MDVVPVPEWTDEEWQRVIEEVFPSGGDVDSAERAVYEWRNCND